MTTIAILDYAAGNVTSVLRAIRYLGFDACISADPEVVLAADKVIFPGVGAAASCMRNLCDRSLDQALRDVLAKGTDVLGICVGMQLLFERSQEDGGVSCMSILPGTVRKFTPGEAHLKVPHMGWNTVRFADDVLAKNIDADAHFYFVHSYYCDPAQDQSGAAKILAQSDHGHEFCAGIRRDNLAAVQFHPEKSGAPGLQLLKNFLES